MQATSLSVQKRTLTGKKVKQLRKQAILPANIFGNKVKSLAVQVDGKIFKQVYKQAGETGIVELTVLGEKDKRPVLITNVQVHPVTDFPLHVDFHQVDLKQKVSATIPLVIKGEAPAVAQKVGALLTPVQEIEVEALPMDLPEEIEVDVTKLATLDEEIKVSDLKVDTNKVTIKTDTALVVAKIGSLITKEAEELAKEVEAKAAEAAAAAAPTEGAPVAEDEVAKPATETSAKAPEVAAAPKEEKK